jgi:hypothetical protein
MKSNEPTQRDLFGGRRDRDRGIDTVIDKEDQTTDYTMDVLRMFLAQRGGVEFIWEDFRIWAVTSGHLSEAHHPNWWGAMASNARKRGLIRANGLYAQMRIRESHARESKCYVAGPAMRND